MMKKNNIKNLGLNCFIALLVLVVIGICWRLSIPKEIQLSRVVNSILELEAISKCKITKLANYKNIH